MRERGVWSTRTTSEMKSAPRSSRTAEGSSLSDCMCRAARSAGCKHLVDKRAFARTAYAADRDKKTERDRHVDVPEIIGGGAEKL